MSSPLLNNFTGGEVTPLLDARIDLQKYASSCRTMENFRPGQHGGAHYRAGTVRVANTRNDAIARLVPFILNTTTKYILEFTNLYVRFYKNGAQLGAPYEIASPYATADLFQVVVKQINSVMYLTHPSYPPYKLVCSGDTSWTLSEMPWTYPPFLDQNITTTTIAPSATTGNITLTASSSIFASSMVGGYFELAYKRDGANVVLDISASAGTTQSSAIQVKGDWSLVTTQYWYGTLRVQRSRDNTQAAAAGWETIREFVSKSSRNVSASGSELTNTWLRLEYAATGNPFGSPPWTGTAPANYVVAQAVLETSQVFVNGLVKVTGYTSGTVVSGTVVGSALTSTNATQYWSESAFSPYRGYPRAVSLFEQRLVFHGTADKPNGNWGSRTGDFENFEYGDTDDAAFFFQLASCQQNAIQWAADFNRMHIGTTGEEVAMGSGNGEEPLTPNNIVARKESAYGSAQIPALQMDSGILFVQRQGRKVRELRETSPYANQSDFTCPDLTLLAPQVTESGITQMDFARLPDPLVLCVRTDGQMAVLTYNREQNVTAWARYVTDGVFESVAVIPSDSGDEVWVSVKRTINGATKRFVEYFDAESFDKTNGLYLDCALKRSGTAVNSLSTLGYLEAKTVNVVADGVFYASRTVASGVVTLPGGVTASVWRVGLPYTGTILPMKIDDKTSDGTTLGKIKGVSAFTLRVYKTLGLKFGQTLDALDDVDWRSINSLLGAVPDLYTGDFTLPWPNRMDISMDLYLQQTSPYPCVILALVPELKTLG